MIDESVRRPATDLAGAAAAWFDNVPEGVWIAAPGGAIVYMNPAGRSLLQLSDHAAPAEAAAYLDALCERDGTPLSAGDLPVARGLRGDSAGGLDLQLPRGDGEPLHLTVSCAPLAGNGDVRGALIQAADRTLQYQIERARDDFLASVAHDLRSPLTAIRGSAQLGLRWAQRDTLERELIERALQTIDAAAGRLNRMLETLMDSARVQRGHLALLCAPTDLVALVREVVDQYQHESRRHTFALDVPDGPLIGHWDGALLERAVENLVGNAVKYSPEGGTVAISAAEEAEAVRFSVRDSGVGIPESALPHIFNRFYRARNATMGEIEGNGLGLFTVRAIVQGHGGSIDVRSVENEGTEMTVRLPRRVLEPALAPAPDTDNGG